MFRDKKVDSVTRNDKIYKSPTSHWNQGLRDFFIVSGVKDRIITVLAQITIEKHL